MGVSHCTGQRTDFAQEKEESRPSILPARNKSLCMNSNSFVPLRNQDQISDTEKEKFKEIKIYSEGGKTIVEGNEKIKFIKDVDGKISAKGPDGEFLPKNYCTQHLEEMSFMEKLQFTKYLRKQEQVLRKTYFEFLRAVKYYELKGKKYKSREGRMEFRRRAFSLKEVAEECKRMAESAFVEVEMLFWRKIPQRVQKCNLGCACETPKKVGRNLKRIRKKSKRRRTKIN